MDDEQALELEALEGILNDPTAEPIKLSYGFLKLITDNFRNEIGRGGFGVVYQGDLQNGVVAVKKITNVHYVTDKQFMDEIKCLKSANHKNIVRFLGYCADTQEEVMPLDGTFVMAGQRNRLLCFEYVPKGNIRQYLEQENTQGDDWPARYKMIRGICQGLLFLHEKQINHLDLKPENVMLDAHMEPRITDFGLSRFLDQGQSKMITEHVVGTLRYIAPEIIDKGEISFKADIYALGIIIIELLSGINMISLENWDESLEELDCPRARRCIEIARNCKDSDRDNRPTVYEIISDLDELESMIPWPSINQVTTSTTSTFPGTELVDVYPLELGFTFMPNQKMHSHLSVTNKTDIGVYYYIILADNYGYEDYMPPVCTLPEISDRYLSGLAFVPPKSTIALKLTREAEEELPSDTDQLEILVLITGCDENVFEQQISTLSLGEYSRCKDTLKAAHELLGFELHRTMLTPIVIVSEDVNHVGLFVTDTTDEGEIGYWFDSMDLHPTEPWVLLVEYGMAVYICNWQTEEKIGKYESFGDSLVAKFISRKKWVVTGNKNGSILVCTCPAMDLVKEFKAHRDCVASLVVHPTRPFLLSCTTSFSLKIWDWSRGWSCTRTFGVTSRVKEIMFNPSHNSSFATHGDDGIVEMWRIGHVHPIGRKPKVTDHFTYIGDQHFIASVYRSVIEIWDWQKEKCAHTLYFTQDIVAILCHPTRPVFVTASENGNFLVWDSTTYRLKKSYNNLRKNPIHVGFTGSSRLIIGYKEGTISVIDIHLE